MRPQSSRAREVSAVARSDNSWQRQLGKYLGLAFMMPCCTFVGYVMGHYLDKAFGTHILTLIFLLFGIAAGFVELFRELKPDDDGK